MNISRISLFSTGSVSCKVNVILSLGRSWVVPCIAWVIYLKIPFHIVIFVWELNLILVLLIRSSSNSATESSFRQCHCADWFWFLQGGLDVGDEGVPTQVDSFTRGHVVYLDGRPRVLFRRRNPWCKMMVIPTALWIIESMVRSIASCDDVALWLWGSTSCRWWRWGGWQLRAQRLYIHTYYLFRNIIRMVSSR